MPSHLALLLVLSVAAVVAAAGCQSTAETPSAETRPAGAEKERRAEAERLAQDAIIVDGHIDVPFRLWRRDEDVAQSTEGGDFDFPRAEAGGLDAAFMSIYIPVERQSDYAAARQLADSLIDRVARIAEEAPEKFALATSPEDVRRHHREGRVALPLGMENGAPVGEDLSNLAYFYDRGIRYITLAHAEANQISDSSYDEEWPHNGLSAFGEEVVQEMNRLGILVDVSHITDAALEDVLRVAEAPVIASHSSARTFTPGFERNLGDDGLRAIAENGGVVMINFGSTFLRGPYQEEGDAIREAITAHLEENEIAPDSPEGRRYFQEERRANPVGTVADVADHIDHVVELVGVEHVGLGSDFDGVFALPEGLQDVSMYPNLVEELLRRGYSEADVRLILGENALRVWEEAERVAARMQNS